MQALSTEMTLMSLGAIRPGSPQWLWPAVGVAFVGLLVLWLAYRRAPAADGVRASAATLKAVGLLLLAFCLIEPLWIGRRVQPGANLFVVLTDNSQSLMVADQGGDEPRAETLRAMVTDEGADWAYGLREEFDVRRYLFDTRLRSVDSFNDLTFDGRGSSLVASIRRVAERFEGRPLAGVLVFTDGNATDVPETGVALAGLPPVYPVVVGRDAPPRDVGVQNVTVSQTSFEDAPVTIKADVAAIGCQDKQVTARLLDEAGNVVEEQTLAVQDETQPVAFRFQLKPTKSGVSFYRLQTGESESFARLFPDEGEPAASHPAEATTRNNARLITVDRGMGKLRVLYVSGRPNWEFKFINRALLEDDQVRLVGLIRVAKREPKFTWKGRRGESTNPLFRGFDRKDEEAEQYDEPVLVRLNAEDETELRSGFPKTAEELYRYHAVIVDDLEAGFFTRDQLTLLERFVSERGGGFMMLGGLESFQRGAYEHTPVSAMLPVYLSGGRGAPGGERMKLALTREGWLQPWVRLRPSEPDERRRIEAMPAFATLNRASSIKPGASILANVIDSAGRAWPALVVQRFGRGRCAAVPVGDLWRWALGRKEDEEQDLEKAWRQTVRWLVADVPQRVSVDARYQRDEAQLPIHVEARARTDRYEPLDNATVKLTIAAPDAAEDDPLVIDMTPSVREPGLYESTYLPREQGAYRAKVDVIDGQGQALESTEFGWTADAAAEEFAALRPNVALLETIAKQTGGEVVEADDLGRLVKSLPTRKAPITEVSVSPLWHTWWLFAIAVSCLIGEWFIRRRRGLP